ncbi:hypothetical protein H4Q26_013634 [Puccinia striiformis f. sp. tritici PST-130]|nr:hypothetical protein H4Q26_013634 [Puccinia striiformis f. sp. tritici PST-130]
MPNGLHVDGQLSDCQDIWMIQKAKKSDYRLGTRDDAFGAVWRSVELDSPNSQMKITRRIPGGPPPDLRNQAGLTSTLTDNQIIRSDHLVHISSIVKDCTWFFNSYWAAQDRPLIASRVSKLIDGDSIYTCSKFTAERDSRMGPVLERRDEDRTSLTHNRPETKNPQQAEEEAGDNHLFSPKTHNRPKKKNPQQAEEEAGDIHLLSPKTHNRPKKKNPQQAEEEEGGNHSAQSEDPATGRRRRGRHERSLQRSSCRQAPPQFPRTTLWKHHLPSSDLLTIDPPRINIVYGSHNVISIPTASRGPRPKKWEEPVAMTRALDGSALMAIEIAPSQLDKTFHP